MEVLKDNEAAIIAMRKGYSQHLRHLHRSKRIHLGYLEEIFDANSPQAHLLKVPTKEQKGDLLTKEMLGPRFEECKAMMGIQPVACTLPGCKTQVLLCIGGEIKSIASGLQELSLANQEPDGQLLPGVDSWVMDSGSGRHLVSRRVLDKNANTNIVKGNETIRLKTANGIVETCEKVRIYVKGLGIYVTAWVLEDTPLVLSLNALAEEHGFDFRLGLRKGRACAWLINGARKTNLPIMMGVPLLKA